MQELVELFTPLGADGAPALEELCRTIHDPDVAATGLDALFESDPARAAAIAEERLARSLEARCVPGSLVALLARRGADPFRAVEKTLQSEACDRRKLRPDQEVRLFWGKEPGAPQGQATLKAARERQQGACRKAFDALFALDRPDPEFSVDPVE